MCSSQFNFTLFSTRSSRSSWVLRTSCISWWITFEQSESTVCMSIVSVLTVYLTSVYGGYVLCLRWLQVVLISEGGFSPPPKKMDLDHKKRKKMCDVRPDERLTSGVRRKFHPTWRPDYIRDLLRSNWLLYNLSIFFNFGGLPIGYGMKRYNGSALYHHDVFLF